MGVGARRMIGNQMRTSARLPHTLGHGYILPHPHLQAWWASHLRHLVATWERFRMEEGPKPREGYGD